MIRRIVGYFWKLVYLLFPPVEYWRADLSEDVSEEVSEYESSLKKELEGFSGDMDKLVTEAEDAHRSEFDRNTHLDSKAGNYLGNVGVVLGILSLGPILSIILGVKDQSLPLKIWPEGIILLGFGYAVIMLLWSAHYSSKALKMRGYSVFFTADAIKDRIEEDETNQKTKAIELLQCTKNNELHNGQKYRAIAIAEGLSRNGLAGLGLGVAAIILVLFPLDPVLQGIQILLSQIYTLLPV